jgi:hypothetical protein
MERESQSIAQRQLSSTELQQRGYLKVCGCFGFKLVDGVDAERDAEEGTRLIESSLEQIETPAGEWAGSQAATATIARALLPIGPL